MSNQNLYPHSSPYYNTNVVSNKYLDVMTYRAIPRNPSDVYFTITNVYQFRPDLLAYDLYGDSRLWWVFAERNPNRLGADPYFDFKTGVGIYIPTLDTLKSVLGI
jgi:hypothetical protein